MEKNNNILLIWPERDKGFYTLDPIGLITGQKTLFFPLPLIYVAAALGYDWNYILVDEGIEPPTEKQLYNSDYFMISVNVLQHYSTDALIKKLLPYKKPIIVGGPLISTLEHIFDYPGVTKVFGEIEAFERTCSNKKITVAQCLSNDMKNNTLKKEYHSIGHPDLTQNNPPRYDLVKKTNYFALSMQTSRGCPHHCDFCQQISLYGRQRRKNPAQVYDELDALLKLRQNITVIIIDDNLMGDISTPDRKQVLIEHLETIKKWQIKNHYPFDFFMQCSLDVAEHEDIVELMSEIGLNIIFVGIETIDNEALASVHKKQNLVKDMITEIRTLQQFGMGVFAGIIIGFDNDSEESLNKQIDFIRQSHIPIVAPSLLQAFPGTPLYKRFKAQNRISRDHDALTKVFHTNVIPLQHPKIIYNYFRRYLEEVYDPSAYFTRCIHWIKNWNDKYVIPGKKGSLPTNVKLARIIRSIFYQGIIAEYRFEYYKYILKSFWYFRTNYNKIALAFYLSYMFQATFNSTKNAVQFVNNLPSYIIEEWESIYVSNQP